MEPMMFIAGFMPFFRTEGALYGAYPTTHLSKFLLQLLTWAHLSYRALIILLIWPSLRVDLLYYLDCAQPESLVYGA